MAVRPWVGVVGCPNCRPPRRKTLKTGCLGRGGLRFGRSGVRRGVHARRCGHYSESSPDRSHANPLACTLTPSYARQPLNMHVGGVAHAHIIGLTCAMSGPRACHRAQVRMKEPRPPPTEPTCASVVQDVPFPTSRANFVSGRLGWNRSGRVLLRHQSGTPRCQATVVSDRTGNQFAGPPQPATSGWA